MWTPSNRFRRHAGGRNHRGRGAVFAPTAVAGLLALGAGLTSCQQREAPVTRGEAGNAATIRVVSGSGRLAGGGEHVIAQWRHGSGPQGGFAQFRGQDGGPVLDLTVTGLSGAGDFACGQSGAGLELRVDVNNTYRAAPGAPCRVEVLHVDDGVMVGRYTATLRHTGNPRDEMTVAGTFRAAAPSPETAAAPAEVEAAKAPRLMGLRK